MTNTIEHVEVYVRSTYGEVELVTLNETRALTHNADELFNGSYLDIWVNGAKVDTYRWDRYTKRWLDARTYTNPNPRVWHLPIKLDPNSNHV